jgi:hypothetical protein
MAVGVGVGVKSRRDKSGRGMILVHNLSEEQKSIQDGTHFVIRYTTSTEGQTQLGCMTVWYYDIHG